MPAVGSNLAVGSDMMDQLASQREADWRLQNGDTMIPEEMKYASGSALDPEISLDNALTQLSRIASIRNWTPEQKDGFARFIISKAVLSPWQSAVSHVNIMVLNAELEKRDAKAYTK
jgi:K+-transporting ATPase c subunit